MIQMKRNSHCKSYSLDRMNQEPTISRLYTLLHSLTGFMCDHRFHSVAGLMCDPGLRSSNGVMRDPGLHSSN